MADNHSRMLSRSRLLIIDYNTFHYTSFDMFRMLLLNKFFWNRLKPEYKPFVRMSYNDQAKFFYTNQTDRDLYHLFSDDTLHEEFPFDMYELISAYYSYPASRFTDTDLNSFLRQALETSMISRIFVLRHKLDQSQINVPDDAKVLRTEGMFQAEAIAKLIDENHIDSVILDSVELAMDISAYTSNVSFIFGTYAYNFTTDAEVNTLKRIDEMTKNEFSRGHEYGLFDPVRAFASIAPMLRKEEENV